ncbi:hypothetical protein HPG69_010624 [Diceros bicornis minor]|uniref:Uncharacterized protein n=1 Tax=Diceros bicornis minor TaxID=77932 RepID=A0A7J7FGB8_DICBM|nr:hypothetical protein HPG69_010624 [Diceros bicornis minor]
MAATEPTAGPSALGEARGYRAACKSAPSAGGVKNPHGHRPICASPVQPLVLCRRQGRPIWLSLKTSACVLSTPKCKNYARRHPGSRPQMWRICVDPVFTREVKAKVRRVFLQSCHLSVAQPPPCAVASSGNALAAPCRFRMAGVRLIREMPQEDLHAVVKNCFAVVNSSVSEGMSAAILEVTMPTLQRIRFTFLAPSTGSCVSQGCSAGLSGGSVPGNFVTSAEDGEPATEILKEVTSDLRRHLLSIYVSATDTLVPNLHQWVNVPFKFESAAGPPGIEEMQTELAMCPDVSTTPVRASTLS